MNDVLGYLFTSNDDRIYACIYTIVFIFQYEIA